MIATLRRMVSLGNDGFWEDWHRRRRLHRLAALFEQRLKLMERLDSTDRLISYYLEQNGLSDAASDKESK